MKTFLSQEKTETNVHDNQSFEVSVSQNEVSAKNTHENVQPTLKNFKPRNCEENDLRFKINFWRGLRTIKSL